MVEDSRGDLHHFFGLRIHETLPTKVDPKLEILGEQGPQSHLKKWNSGVRLEQGARGKSLFPVNIKIRGRVRTAPCVGPSEVGAAFQAGKCDNEGIPGRGLPRLEVAQLTCTSTKGLGAWGSLPPPAPCCQY